jgi:hypothetical protein
MKTRRCESTDVPGHNQGAMHLLASKVPLSFYGHATSIILSREQRVSLKRRQAVKGAKCHMQ